ncbi:UDP-N-acetylmuramate dehydrogenase [Caldanaerobius polysaccharolyticus]|uniref:UDP-N-acetylmuramate dehydrogenase n=1 Tax=Caldanaerobius polysaccharolyticus TaxID=44256 RepID=UPI00047AE4AF|nr:UDP-N-acetylmuramate dehydrogenase [Caldanaerobius polysaccharolyticus]
MAKKLEDITVVLKDELMSRHTSFKIGGKADYLVLPRNEDELRDVLIWCKQTRTPYFVMGNGTNLLVKDKGIRGVVIKIADNFSRVTVDGENLEAGAGILLSRLARIALKNELSGMEGLSGIPGTLGGAVMMNAGAYGYEIQDIFVKCTVMDENGQVFTYTKADMDFGYRKTALQGSGKIVLNAVLKLQKGDCSHIKALMDDFTHRRQAKQPLSQPSAGSVFKRPAGYYAGKLIQEAGLMGFRIGDAQVSEKHAGFIVNLGSATADDVLRLIEHVRKTVRDKFGVELEPEVKIVGE